MMRDMQTLAKLMMATAMTAFVVASVAPAFAADFDTDVDFEDDALRDGANVSLSGG